MTSNTTTYSSWSETDTPTYGDLTAANAAYCHEANGTVSNQYSGTPTDTESAGWYGNRIKLVLLQFIR